MTRSLVAQQYDDWPYPLPVEDIAAYLASGHIDRSDPSIVGPVYWPRRKAYEGLNILVAGCGTKQAAVIAYCNPTCQVTGIDISETALAYEQRLKAQHQLLNLNVFKADLVEAGKTGQQYDLIVSTGVLHHLKEPEIGLQSIARLLKPDGVMSLMLYGRSARTGVYMLQEAFRILGLTQSQADVASVKSVLASLPPSHPATIYLKRASDLGYDSGIVDTFLHPQDRAYSVLEIASFLEQANLQFQGWMDPLLYAHDVHANIPPEVRNRLTDLDALQRAHVVDLLGTGVGSHRFIAAHGHRDPQDWMVNFSDDKYLAYIPEWRRGLQVVREAQGPDGAAKLHRAGHVFALTGDYAHMLRAADGKRTIAEIIEGTQFGGSAGGAIAKELFAKLHEWGHIFIRMPQAT